MPQIFTETTAGIKVSVETFYQAAQSQPLRSHFVFAYRITLVNDSMHTVQLKSRHWIITDACGMTREVQGEGVVGEQPILEPGESFQYVSGCDFNTEIGIMKGSYKFERQIDMATFDVAIPEFMMTVPHKQN
jgi:ApaG protein